MRILVTGGAGYIGSHTCVVLLDAQHEVVVLDNLCNSSIEVFERVAKIATRPVKFVNGDVRDEALVRNLLREYEIDAVFHFAGLKAVGESVLIPLTYYDNNVGGSLALCHAMKAERVKTLIFSSSASVYGEQSVFPITESSPPSNLANPYAKSKMMVEQMLDDITMSDSEWGVACLRYFNPVGAHISGLIGESPTGEPNNLMAYVAQVAVGHREKLMVFGDDYPTLDGTGVRDYIHVMDLAEGHLAALNYILKNRGNLTVNLGTGKGFTVLEMVKAFEINSGQLVPYEVVGRRVGDIAECWADTQLSKHLLGWKAKRDVSEMCQDMWRWIKSSKQDDFIQGDK